MELSKKQLAGIVAISILMGGGIIYTPEITYVCKSRGIVQECDLGLSESGKTCKISTRGNFRCPEPWEMVDDFANLTNEQPHEPEFCKAEGNNDYWLCYSSKGRQTYFGEIK